MNTLKLKEHIRVVCSEQLKDMKSKICDTCPFEDQIIQHYPMLRDAFEARRDYKRHLSEMRDAQAETERAIDQFWSETIDPNELTML